jgi:predicted phosphodiesterase
MKHEIISALAEKIIAGIKKFPPIDVSPAKIKQGGRFDEEEFILLVSDLQAGHKTKTFNLSVLKERGKILVDRLLKITAIHRASHPVRNINLFLLGDNIHNETIGRFLGLDEFDGVVMSQIWDGAMPVLSHLIASCAKNFEKVKVYCVRGNHGNMGKLAATTTNFDDVIYHFLRLQFKEAKNVEFRIADNFYQIVRVKNTKFMLTHGDSIKMWMNIPSYGIVQRLMRWQGSTEQFDVLVLGHFHNFWHGDWNDKEFIVNGTFVTDDDWVRKNMGLSGSCVQTLLSVHERQGITFTRKIKLWR